MIFFGTVAPHPESFDCRINASSGVLDLHRGDWFAITLNGSNGTLSLVSEPPTRKFWVEITQAASGGPYTPTFWSGITWMTANGQPPPMPVAAGAVLLVGIKTLGNSQYYGWVENDGSFGPTQTSTWQALPAPVTGTITIDWSKGNRYFGTLPATSVTLAYSNVPAAGTSQILTFRLVQPSGGCTVTWPTGSVYPGGSAPALSSSTGDVDTVVVSLDPNGTGFETTLVGANYH